MFPIPMWVTSFIYLGITSYVRFFFPDRSNKKNSWWYTCWFAGLPIIQISTHLIDYLINYSLFIYVSLLKKLEINYFTFQCLTKNRKTIAKKNPMPMLMSINCNFFLFLFDKISLV
jgi:hypothetical protein